MATYDPYKIQDCITVEFEDGDIILERSKLDIRTFGGNYKAEHTVMEGETLSNIANQYYGDSGYWPVIADINSIYEPLNDLVPGMILLIP